MAFLEVSALLAGLGDTETTRRIVCLHEARTIGNRRDSCRLGYHSQLCIKEKKKKALEAEPWKEHDKKEDLITVP